MILRKTETVSVFLLCLKLVSRRFFEHFQLISETKAQQGLQRWGFEKPKPHCDGDLETKMEDFGCFL